MKRLKSFLIVIALATPLFPIMLSAQGQGAAAGSTPTVAPATTLTPPPLPPSQHEAGGFPPVTLEVTGPPRREAMRNIHPLVTFLDADGKPVSQTQGALSLMNTCGQCHDTTFIEQHNYHAQAGMDELRAPGAYSSSREWDQGPGLFGRWSPLTYRTLTPQGWGPLDLGTADWIKVMGPRHVGGGPAVYSRFSGKPLTELGGDQALLPDTHVIDPQTGEPVPWDWQKSGTVELNCLLCHFQAPDNSARVAEINAGRFRWASTATLASSGMVSREGDGLRWNPSAFDGEGRARLEFFQVADPKAGNCRICHGSACRCTDPVIFENSLDNWAVETTGEIFSPARVHDSGMNIENRRNLYRPWDVHAERLLDCANCHYSMNNPNYNEKENQDERPSHLNFDARRLDVSEYLVRPDHNLVKGHTSQGTVARRLDGSMRDCRDCHDPYAGHKSLPMRNIHFAKLSCQSCHINRVTAPARQATDWTMLTPDGSPQVEHRGVQGRVNDPESLITGYRPLLLEHEESDGGVRLGPHNLITSWYWVAGAPPRPVRLVDLKKAIFDDNGGYRTEITAALDTDKNGILSPAETRLDTEAKTNAVRQRLLAIGLTNPQIRGEIQPYTVSHGVAGGEYVIKECTECHGVGSRVTSPFTLADHVPGGVMPKLVGDAKTKLHGDMVQVASGGLVFQPSLDPEILYLHGADRPRTLDYLGMLAVLGSLFGVMVHGALRFVAKKKRG